MNLKSLPSFPSFDKDELLSRVGLQTEPSTGYTVATTLATFGVGVLVGAVLGLILAPKSGPSLREDLRERIRKVPDDVKTALTSAKEKVASATGISEAPVTAEPS